MLGVLVFVGLVIGERAYAPQIKLHYRTTARPDMVFRRMNEPYIRLSWKTAADLYDQFKKANYYDLDAEQMREFSKAVWRDPRSWGHVAIEFEEPIIGKGRVIGWRPRASMDDVLRVLEPRISGRQLSKDEALGSLPGAFFSEEDWLRDIAIPVRVNTVALQVSQRDYQNVKDNVQAIEKLGSHRYQLSQLGQRPWGRLCYNCVSILHVVFRDIPITLPDIPKSGNISSFDAAVKTWIEQEITPCSQLALGAIY